MSDLVVVVKSEWTAKEDSLLEGGVLAIPNTEVSSYKVRGRSVKTVVLSGLKEDDLLPNLREAIKTAQMTRVARGELDFMFSI